MSLATAPSIRRTLLLWLGLLFAVGMAVLFLAARSYGHGAADLSYDRLLRASALAIAESVSLSQGRWMVDLPYTALDLLAMAPDDRVFYRVAAPDGSTVTGYDDLPTPPQAPVADRTQFFDAMYRGEMVRFALLGRWLSDPMLQGPAWVQVGQTRLARDALAREIALGAVLPIALLTLAALALVWIGVNRALRPLLRVERDLSAREPSDLRAIEGPVPTELSQLVAALNRFMTRLAANIDGLRAFIAEAAHQMRTPLASLHAQAQLALDDDDPAQQRRSIEAIERNAARLGRLLNQLLSDATVLHRADLRHFETVDLVDIVQRALREALPLADPPRLRFDCRVREAALRGDALMLREAIKNLVDNALRHGAPERGEIVLMLDTEKDMHLLTVTDHGPGLPPELRERAFERFARGADAAPGGAGLGLAIVKRVVDSHGSRIELGEAPGGGLVVRLQWPRAAP
jgi:two-component system sensor histidine kinase TctE